jgi:hypothetical protein
MVNASWFSLLKRGAMLINTSRGGVVQETDLIAAIDAGRLGGVALDVWQHEPNVNAELANRVDIATPHIAGHSVEARRRAAGMVRDALAGSLGESPGQLQQSSSASRDGTTGASAFTATGATSGGPGSIGAVEGPVEAWNLHTWRSPHWWMSSGDAVLRACDIAGLTRSMRAWIGRPGAADAFDGMRRMPRARREFPAYQVGIPPSEGALGVFLRFIGFRVHDSRPD